MPKIKSPLETITALHPDRLEIIMEMLQLKSDTKKALMERNKTGISTSQAAVLFSVTRQGLSYSENRIIAFDKRLESIYCR